MIASFVGVQTIKILVHALDYYIKNADDKKPSESDNICGAANIAESLKKILNEEKKKRNLRMLNP